MDIVEQTVQTLGVLDSLGNHKDPLAVVDGVVEGLGGLLDRLDEELHARGLGQLEGVFLEVVGSGGVIATEMVSAQ